MLKKRFLMMVLLSALVLSACSTPIPLTGSTASPTPDAMMTANTPGAMMATTTQDDMMASKTPDAMMASDTPGAMMGTEAPGTMMVSTTPDAMMATTPIDMMMASKTPDAMMATKAPDAMMSGTPEEMMGSPTPAAMMGAPAWFSNAFTDVTTGSNFTISGFQGKVVLVEFMATWCPNCLEQHKQIQAYLNAAGMNDQLKVISLDIDLHEDSLLLKTYVTSNGFSWAHAVVTADVAREVSQLYGDQFLNPTATPMLIVDKHGVTHLLPFGLKDAKALKQALDPHLNM
jgi:thiol-disulfide isomerase/thioredoxin